MPIFDFRCPGCNKTCELLIMADRVPACPHCGAQHLEKQVSAPAAPGKSKEIIAKARSQAAKEGHLSNFSQSEISRK